MFNALSRLTRRPRLVLSLSLLIVVALVVLGRGAGSRLLVGGTENPAAQSSVASATLDSRFPSSMTNLVLLVQAGPGLSVDDPRVSAEGASLTSRLDKTRSVIGVRSYWQTRSTGLRSANGRYALIEAYIPGTDSQAGTVYNGIAASLGGRQGPVTVSFAGQVAVNHEIRTTISSDLKTAELIAVPITLVILILIFGSLIAALLPVVIGIVSILGTDAALKVITEFTSVSVFAQNLTTALSLGLGIDYALLLTRRFREEQRKGRSPHEAAVAALRTAGRTVVFSALTVAISLSSMLVFPMFFLRSFAYAGISVVLFAAISAVIIMPAALALLGNRVNALDLRRLLARPFRRQGSAAAASGRQGSAAAASRGGWARFATMVMRRAPVFTGAVVIVLVVLGLPFFHVQFGIADYRQLPAGAQTRVTQQTLDANFPVLPTGVITVLAGTSSQPALAEYATRISRLPDTGLVVSAAGAYRNGHLVQPPTAAGQASVSGTLSYLSVHPDSPDISAQSETLVRAIRAVPEPFTTMVTGDAAQVVDTEHAIASDLPSAIAIIVLATLLIIFLFTGSLLVPLLSVVMSVLSLSATFGAIVWVFQYGHGSGLLNFTPTGFIDVTLPVLMFCVAFGLSMDYSMFVLSRIKERYDETADPRASVAYGMERTGGIITAAALILAIVLIAIGSSHVTNIKMFGLGVALAVLIDALVVRCLLVPAVLALAGQAAWWAPRPLRKFVSRIGLQEETSDPPANRLEPNQVHLGSPSTGRTADPTVGGSGA
jgi:RND superfamily putative drug exporter